MSSPRHEVAGEAERLGEHGFIQDFESDRPIPTRMIAEILRSSSRSPSSFHLQPWRFLVVRNKSNRDRLSRCAFNDRRLTNSGAVVTVLGYLNPHQTHLQAIVQEATDRLAVLPTECSRWVAEAERVMGGLGSLSEWASRWGLVAASSLALAAEARGVGAVVIDRFDEPRIRREFGIPLDHTVAALVALGYVTKRTKDPGVLDLEELCFEEFFGQPWFGEKAPKD